MKKFDLLEWVEYGGCSAKLPARELEEALQGLVVPSDARLLVGTETHDDAGVYRISDELALIHTTDFFPPMCSDPYDFGQIAAANALSDVYAMGGQVLSALNLVMFPADAPLEALREILRGGTDKLTEAGGVMAGGHTIVDAVPKYGMAVTGSVHPSRVITNAEAAEGDVLILTKAIGTGVVLAGHRIGSAGPDRLKPVLDSMKHLNREGARCMQEAGVRCATDITGFGLAGHALKLAVASGKSLVINTGAVPLFDGASELAETGCLPGACFRNLEYTDGRVQFEKQVSYELKMLMLDAQTSGGLLICCRPEKSQRLLTALTDAGYSCSRLIGRVSEPDEVPLYFI